MGKGLAEFAGMPATAMGEPCPICTLPLNVLAEIRTFNQRYTKAHRKSGVAQIVEWLAQEHDLLISEDEVHYHLRGNHPR